MWSIPIPYYLYFPGEAVPLEQVVTVEAAQPPGGGGRLMMTTVNTLPANGLLALWAFVWPSADLVPVEQVRRSEESAREYALRQKLLMTQAQESAIAAAFRQAGRRLELRQQGMLVLGFANGSQARAALQVGDVITYIDGIRVTDMSQLAPLSAHWRSGDVIKVSGSRGGQPFEAELTLMELDSGRAGLGIYLQEKKELFTDRRVQIDIGNVGGPSAGLMLSLEILRQLSSEEDLTRGKKVAGTGTIDAEGRVGQVGGIPYKVLAAARKGADLFLVPADGELEGGNAAQAIETARRHRLKLQVVPVATLEEALSLLAQVTETGWESMSSD